MNKSFLLCICALALAGTTLFAQAPSDTPIPNPTAATATTATTSLAAPSLTSTAAPVRTATASSGSSDLADRIHQKLEKKLRGKHGIIIDGDDHDATDREKSHDDIPEFVIPIVAITMLTIFGAPVLIVGLIMYFSFSRSRALHRTVRMMVEKGQPVPEALLNPPPAQRQRSDMRRGIVLTMIGLGIGIFLAATDSGGSSWTLGIIPFLIGVGYLLVWRLEGRKDNPPPVR
jgi:hypothetical protein